MYVITYVPLFSLLTVNLSIIINGFFHTMYEILRHLMDCIENIFFEHYCTNSISKISIYNYKYNGYGEIQEYKLILFAYNQFQILICSIFWYFFGIFSQIQDSLSMHHQEIIFSDYYRKNEQIKTFTQCYVINKTSDYKGKGKQNPTSQWYIRRVTRITIFNGTVPFFVFLVRTVVSIKILIFSHF